MKKYYPSVSEETLRDYESKQMRSAILSPNFDLPIKYVLFDAYELKKAQDTKQMVSFYKKNLSDAAHVIRLSNIGFNNNRTQAFVDIEIVLCPLCGEGNVVLLEKESGVWSIKEKFQTWIS